MSTLTKSEREELSLLLPWYANGTLDSEDSRKVEAALAEDEGLAREFDLVLEDQAVVIELVSEEQVPISMAERFKAALHAEQTEPEASAQSHDPEESLITRVLSVLFPAGPRAYAFVGAMVVALVPVVAVVSYMAGSQQTTQYQTASGDVQIARERTRVLVQFNTDIAWAEIDAFLKKNRGQVVTGPTADGLYELEFQMVDGPVEELGGALGIFEFVLPVN